MFRQGELILTMNIALSSAEKTLLRSAAATDRSVRHGQPEAARQLQRRLARWLLVVLGCAFVALIARLGEVTHDAFHEMALFREFVTTGEFPMADVFAYTPTVSPSVHHEWGTGAILYGVTVGTGWGLGGLTVLKIALVSAMWFAMYRVARLRGVHPYLFSLLAIAVFPMLWVGFATIRATMFTLLCVSLQLWMHEWDRRGRRLWLVPWWLMLVVWLNLHAGFVVGLGLLGLHAIERFATLWWQSRSLSTTLGATWHLALMLPLAALALPINPYGWQYVPYLVRAITMPRPRITEWLPLWYTHQPAVTLLMFALSLALVAIAVRRHRGSELLGLLGLCVCALMAAKHLRHGPIYSVLWIAYCPAWLSHTSFGLEIVRYLKRAPVLSLRAAQGLAAGLLVWSAAYGFGATTLSGDLARQSTCYPIAATQYLAEHNFSGNLLTPFHAGAYVSWRLAPQVKVSLDGRYEVAYAPQVFEEHWEFFEAGPAWARLLDKYPHDAVLVPQSAKVRPLLEVFRGCEAAETQQKKLPTQQAWRFVYEDAAYVILARPQTDL